MDIRKTFRFGRRFCRAVYCGFVPLLFLVLFSASHASAMPGMAGKENLSERFKAMDADADGLLSSKEFADGLPQMRDTAFGMMDADKDGFVSLEEWEKAMSAHMGAGAMPPPSGPEQGADAPGMEPAHTGGDAGPDLIMPDKKRP